MADPLPRRVYVRRRLIVVGVLVAVVVAVMLLIVLPGRATPPSANPVDIPEDLHGAPAAAEGRESDEPVDCPAGRVTVTPLLDQSEYAAGELPQLALSVVNTSEDECILNLGTADLVFEITSGAEEVWRSTDCQANGDTRPIILVPGEALETEPLVWDRTQSDPDTCDITRTAVTAGGASYHLRATAGGVASGETAQFMLY